MLELSIPVILLGACVGSFLNVVICRIPKDQSFIFPRSRCPICSNQIKGIDLIPIFSWILLKRRCRYCFNLISIKYPLIELLTSALFFICYKTSIYYEGFFFSLLLVFFGWILSSQ